MPTIAVSPFILRDVLLRFSYGEGPTTNDYEKHVSQVQWDPSSSSVVWKGLNPDSTFTKTATATWACTLAFAQDWETPNSLSLFLFEHEGEEIECTFEPVKGGASWAATLQITPGAIGGEVDTVAAATVTLGSTKPDRTPAS